MPYGLNLIGTAPVATYEALVPSQYHVLSLLPEAKTLIVIGNGGGQFWQGFRAYCDEHPAFLNEREHPLDDYTVEITEKALTPILMQANAQYRYLYPFRFWSEPVSFMHLARAAGLAGPSILGVTIHPVYGPWMALRAAVLINSELHTEPSAAGFDPCPTCAERACISACPAKAISVEKNWDIPTCVQHRLRVTTDCVDYCRARFDCVYGREHRYPFDELQYHQRQSFAEMRKYFEGRKSRPGFPPVQE
jgi:NAD-dependent dihydropyrimidine dehydrogenase PreA subunit